jgi:peptide/nickel transport system permease protein
VLYSLPSFWIATLLIVFFGGGDYLHLFPSYGLHDLDSSAPFFQRVLDLLYHLVLPLICWTYPSFAFLSRQMRGGMLNVIHEDFIRTAKAKGLDDKHVYWKHAFRNSLLPVITLFANIFPFVIGGSIVLEYIFSIPGMGRLTYDAITERNYPVVYAVTMFSAVLTLVGYLVADILYAVADPRITFSQKHKT